MEEEKKRITIKPKPAPKSAPKPAPKPAPKKAGRPRVRKPGPAAAMGEKRPLTKNRRAHLEKMRVALRAKRAEAKNNKSAVADPGVEERVTSSVQPVAEHVANPGRGHRVDPGDSKFNPVAEPSSVETMYENRIMALENQIKKLTAVSRPQKEFVNYPLSSQGPSGVLLGPNPEPVKKTKRGFQSSSFFL